MLILQSNMYFRPECAPWKCLNHIKVRFKKGPSALRYVKFESKRIFTKCIILQLLHIQLHNKKTVD